jgi:hypothetical protein
MSVYSKEYKFPMCQRAVCLPGRGLHGKHDIASSVLGTSLNHYRITGIYALKENNRQGRWDCKQIWLSSAGNTGKPGCGGLRETHYEIHFGFGTNGPWAGQGATLKLRSLQTSIAWYFTVQTIFELPVVWQGPLVKLRLISEQETSNNKAIRKIFGIKRKEVNREWGILRSWEPVIYEDGRLLGRSAV